MVMMMRLLIVSVLVAAVVGVNVTYNHRAVVIDGRRRVLVSGSIHYPRSTPDVSIHVLTTDTHTFILCFVFFLIKKCFLTLFNLI